MLQRPAIVLSDGGRFCHVEKNEMRLMSNPLKAVTRRVLLAVTLVTAFTVFGHGTYAQTDPLPSWNDGTAKKSITDFVGRVT